MTRHYGSGALPDPPINATIRLTQTFDSGMRGVYEGVVTYIGPFKEIPRADRYITLNSRHWFIWAKRSCQGDQWCSNTYEILALPEPSNGTVWKVDRHLSGRDFIEVWMRCDDPMVQTNDQRRHWVRLADNAVYTWDEVCAKLRAQNGGSFPDIIELEVKT